MAAMTNMTFKTLITKDYPQNRTNFNNWSDPKFHSLKHWLTNPIEREYLNNLPTDLGEKEQPLNIPSITDLEIEDIQTKIKLGQPLLRRKEIRNIRLPFYESLVLNLEEDGFVTSSEYIKKLIALDDRWHRQTRHDYTIEQRPFLKQNKPILISLSEGLQEAEKENGIQEIRCLLSLASGFESSCQWQWIAEELYGLCVSISKGIQNTEYEQEMLAIAKYLYGKFIFVHLHDPVRARPILEDSMKFSEGTVWNASYFTNQEEDLLYFETCHILIRVYLEIANEVQDYDIDDAAEFCKTALRLAKQTKRRRSEAKALIHMAALCLASDQLTPVPAYLEDYIQICKDLKNVKGLCDGYSMLTRYYELKGNDDLIVPVLKNLLELAEKNEFKHLIAMAHRKLASCLKGKEREVKDHAIEAYNRYSELKNKPEIEETRCLVAVCLAQDSMPTYIKLVSGVDRSGTDEFKILMHWKLDRIPFFPDDKLRSYQPESDTNEHLVNKIESLRNEELGAKLKDIADELSRSSISRIKRRSVQGKRSNIKKTNRGDTLLKPSGSLMSLGSNSFIF